MRRPRTWITVRPGADSAEASLYGLLTGSTRSTPGTFSSPRLWIICGSPKALTTIESVPGATRP